MSQHNGNGKGAAAQTRSERVAQLGRELAGLIAELEALAIWAAGQEERQARLEILVAACKEERELWRKASSG